MAGGTGDDEITGKITEISKKIEERIEGAPDSELCSSILKYLGKHQYHDGFHLNDMAEQLGRTEGYIIENMRYLRSVNILNKQFFMTPDAALYAIYLQRVSKPSS